MDSKMTFKVEGFDFFRRVVDALLEAFPATSILFFDFVLVTTLLPLLIIFVPSRLEIFLLDLKLYFDDFIRCVLLVSTCFCFFAMGVMKIRLPLLELETVFSACTSTLVSL